MTVRFFILQSHYRGTLDFSNEALQSSEKALKRLWEAYNWFIHFEYPTPILKYVPDIDQIEDKVKKIISEFSYCMDDDFNTAKLIGLIFELVPILNSLKDKRIPFETLSLETAALLKINLKNYVSDVLGLEVDSNKDKTQIDGILQLLISIRKEAKLKKDFVTSDKIRNELAKFNIQLKDEKDGGTSYSFYE